MTYLKSTESDFYPGVILTELTALQRLHYLEYLSDEEERLLRDEGQEAGAVVISAMNIRISTRLVALSLMATQRSEIDPLDDEASKKAVLQMQHEILSQWSWEGIAACAIQVRRLSGMLPPEGREDEQDGEEAATAEKR